MMYMIAPWQMQCLTRHAVSQKLGHRLELQYVPIDAAESKMSEQKTCYTHIETRLASFPFDTVKYRSSHIGQLLWSAIPASLSMLCHMLSHTDHVIFVMKHHLSPFIKSFVANPKFNPMGTVRRQAGRYRRRCPRWRPGKGIPQILKRLP